MLLGTDKYGRTAWHIAAVRGNSENLQKLCEWAKENLTPEEIKNMLFMRDDEGSTAERIAANYDNPEISQKLWEWAKEILTQVEIKNKLLLGTHIYQSMAWHIAAEKGNSETLQK